MMKFFRKHNKKLLAVFMALLLIVWLGGTALQAFLTRGVGDAEFGTAFGQAYTRGDVRPIIERQIDILSYMGIPWEQPWMFIAGRDIGRDPLEPYEWFLLTEEARRQGSHVSSKLIGEFKSRFPSAAARIDAVRSRRRASLAEIDAAIGRFLSVQQPARRAAAALKVTEPEMRRYVRNIKERIRVKMFAVPASAFEEPDEAVTPEELSRQFEQYKDTPPKAAAGPSEFGFGYQQPGAVQIEYLVADIDKLVELTAVPTEQDALAYFKKNRKQFPRKPRKPEKPATATAPSTSSAPAGVAVSGPAGSRPATQAASSRPSEETPKTGPVTFTEVQDDVVQKLRRERAIEQGVRLMRSIAKDLNASWLGAEIGEDGYPAVPEGAEAEDLYPKLRDKLAGSLHGPALRYEKTAGLLTRAELASRPEVAGARLIDSGDPPMLMAQAAFQVQGLVDKPKPEADADAAQMVQDEFFLARYQTCPSLVRDRSGNVYVYRAIVVRPPGPPDSIEDVKEEVEADVRARRAYERALAAANAFAEQARQVGIDKAFADAADLRARIDKVVATRPAGLAAKAGPSPVIEPEPFARKTLFSFGGSPGMSRLSATRIREAGYEATFPDACFAMARGEASATAPQTRPSTNTVIVHEQRDPRNRRVLVVQWVETLPLRQDVYDSERPVAAISLAMERRSNFLSHWFSREQIEKRTGWKPARTEAQTEGEGEDQSGEQTSTE